MASDTVFRKLAPFIWKNASEAATFASVTVEMNHWATELAAKKISLLEILVLAVKRGHHCEPSVSSYVSFGRVRNKPHLSVTIMAPHEKNDLAFITIKDIDVQTDLETLDELRAKLQSLRETGGAMEFVPLYRILKIVPVWILFLTMPLLRFFVHRFKIPWIPKKPFGDVIISNVGTLGFDHALLPMTPLARAGLMIALGRLKKSDAQSAVTLGFTMDHRLMDGIHAQRFMTGFLPFFNGSKK